MKRVLAFMVLILFSLVLFADARPIIDSLVNEEIFIADGFAGQSITLTKEAKGYFIIRKFFGSGRPIIAKLKYPITFDSDYQIRFSKVIDGKRNDLRENIHEEFILSIIEKGKIQLLLNGIQVVIKSSS